MYKEIASPILDRLDSETWHVRAREALHFAESNIATLKLLEFFADKHKRFTDPRLKVNMAGINFENPVTVAAGWDKVGSAVKGLYQLGFSGVEVGSVLQYPQKGNDKPRQFVIGPGVVLNKLGFNSPGMEVVAENLKRYKNSGIPIGISIGINKEVSVSDAPQAHAEVARKLYKFASYFAINVSSPNTKGLREMQDRKPLTDIVQAVNSAMDEMGGRKPVFVKIAPDLTNNAVDDVIRVVFDNNLTGIIATNTTINSEIKRKYVKEGEAGGISGNDNDYRQMSTEKIAHVYKETNGEKIVIGVGAINSAETAWQKMAAGATIVQVNSAIRSEGTALPGKINRGLVERMDREGIKNITEVIGSAHK